MSIQESERRRQRLESLRQNVVRRGYSVDGWCHAFDRSRATAYDLMRKGKLEFVYLGGRRFIPTEAAEKLLTLK